MEKIESSENKFIHNHDESWEKFKKMTEDNLRPRYIYPIELILTGASFLFNYQKKKHIPKDSLDFKFDMTESYETQRAMLLYCLIEVEKDKFLPLNREYKPIGLSGYFQWINYENYPFLFIDKECINLDILRKKYDNKFLYLFGDKDYPYFKSQTRKYFNTLENLFIWEKITIQVENQKKALEELTKQAQDLKMGY